MLVLLSIEFCNLGTLTTILEHGVILQPNSLTAGLRMQMASRLPFFSYLVRSTQYANMKLRPLPPD